MSSRLEHIAPRAVRVWHLGVDAVFAGRMIRRTRRRTRRDYALQFRAGFNLIAHRFVHGCSRSRESAFSLDGFPVRDEAVPARASVLSGPMVLSVDAGDYGKRRPIPMRTLFGVP